MLEVVGDADDVLDDVLDRRGWTVGDQCAHAGVPQDVLDLGIGEASVDRHDHESGGGERHVRLDVGVAVRHEQRDPIARSQTEGGEPSRDRAAAQVELSERQGELRGGVDDGG